MYLIETPCYIRFEDPHVSPLHTCFSALVVPLNEHFAKRWKPHALITLYTALLCCFGVKWHRSRGGI